MAAESSANWLVILNQSLAESELHRLLQSHQHKIKVCTGTLPHTCLFPQSSVAFMVVPLAEVLSDTARTNDGKPRINSQLMKNLVKFSKLHHKRYVLLCSPLIGTHEQKILSLLQQKFLMKDLQFIPAHNSQQCIEHMLSIVKLNSRPLSTLIRRRYDIVKEHLLMEESVVDILHEIGVKDESQSVLVLDGCGGLAGVGRASVEELLDYNLDGVVAVDVHNVLHTKS